MCLPALKPVYCISCSFFSFLHIILLPSELTLLRYGHKRVFDGFQTGFTAFAVLFLKLLNFLLRRSEGPLLKYVLECVFASFETGLVHSSFFISHFEGFYESIGGTVAKIHAKMCVNRLCNRFYSFNRSFFSILEEFLHLSEVPLPRYRRNHVVACFQTGFMTFAVLFLAIWRLFCVNRRYLC